MMVAALRVSSDGEYNVDGDDRDRIKAIEGGPSTVAPRRRAVQYQTVKKTLQYSVRAGFGGMNKGAGGVKLGVVGMQGTRTQRNQDRSSSLQKVPVPLASSSGTYDKPSLRITPGSTSSSWKDVCVMGRWYRSGF